jgi:hypothetical protein
MATCRTSASFQSSALGLHPLATVGPAALIAAEMAPIVRRAISIQ